MRKTMAIIVLMGMVLAYYFYLSEETKNQQQPLKEVDKLINYDLKENYPTTPREVVRLYSRVIKFMYAEEYKEDKYTQLANQLRNLFDEELLKENPYHEYIENLRTEIQEYKEAGKKIISYRLNNTTQSDYVTVDNIEYCKIQIIYEMIDSKKSDIKLAEEFLLQKDSSGKWKIKGWRKVEPLFGE